MIFEYQNREGVPVPVRSMASIDRLIAVGALDAHSMVRTTQGQWCLAKDTMLLKDYFSKPSSELSSAEVILPSEALGKMETPRSDEKQVPDSDDSTNLNLENTRNAAPITEETESLPGTTTVPKVRKANLKTAHKTWKSSQIAVSHDDRILPSPASAKGEQGTSRKTFSLFSFEGRAPRSHYWIISICAVVVSISFEVLPPVLILILLIPLIWINLSITVRRCHDRNHSSWYFLWTCVPIVNIFIFIELAFFRGTAGVNAYGDDPLQ